MKGGFRARRIGVTYKSLTHPCQCRVSKKPGNVSAWVHVHSSSYKLLLSVTVHILRVPPSSRERGLVSRALRRDDSGCPLKIKTRMMMRPQMLERVGHNMALAGHLKQNVSDTI